MIARVPPHNLSLERALLGCVLLEGRRAMDLLAGTPLVVVDFYAGRHRLVYEAMVKLHVADEPIDLVTVHEALARAGTLDEVGGAAALAGLVEEAAIVGAVERYVRSVVDYGQLREIVSVATGVVGKAFEAGQSAADLLGELDAALDRIRGRCQGESYDPAVYWSRMVEGWQRGTVKLGLAPLDEVTGGLGRGDLVVVGGRSSHGKTALMAVDRPLALAVAGLRVDVIALEEPEAAITRRWVANLADVSIYALRTGILEPAEFARAETAVRQLQGLPLRCVGIDTLRSPDERGVLSVASLSRADVIVLDHARKVEYRRVGKQDLLTYAIGRFLNRLHAIAQRDRKVVIVVTQLDRAIERQHRKPSVGDLMDSQTFEQAARTILLLWWPWKVRAEKHDPHDYEVYVAKNSEGGTGKVELRYRAAVGRFGTREDLL